MPTPSDSYSAAFAASLRWLGRREYAQSELHTKLLQRGFHEAIIRSVLDELVSEGLQSEQRFTECYMRARIARGYGPKRIEYELQQKQVSLSLIAQCMQSYDQNFWMNLACNVVYKKINGKTLTNLRDKAKLVRYLQQKGYTHDQISFAVNELAFA